ncbi:ribosomal protein S6 kinase delta-1 isoform X2 [Hippoglossus stenolepis]|uniref:ribosomal protein S6 kinase delta-1 isoform X2 n=1 Tax=Hippoglossus stenolepis TaxID=195615 RepID=UPI001FB0238C|nr:ribosomal protein S6 kinase delta-1 isoform X2 [Hippoglossus stenolepis]
MISQRDRGELARFYTVTDPKKHQKGYTVYKVTARIISRKNPEDVQEITVWKRYSDFRKLHHNLWQLHKDVCSQSELFPPFAKAKVFGRFDDSVIEERRQCSEDLLQFSANIPALYSSQHIQDFFKGGEVHDGSELIGPAEPFSDFLADSLSDCSSDVQRDFSGADDLTITSEYGGEASPTRREAVKKKTADYLMRAEQISSQHLRSNMGQGSTQTVALGAQCCPSTSRAGQQSPSDELRAYRVLGVIDKVLLVMDKRTEETFILKGLRKSSDCGRTKRTIMPHSVPHMVQLRKFVVSENTVFLLLQYAEGGKLWSHIEKYLHTSSPEESFDIPFIQKSHTTAVHTPQPAVPQLDVDSAGSGSGPVAGSISVSELQKKGGNIIAHLKRVLPTRLIKQTGAQSDSGANSEEECTNSYLTLCNEYEQDKVEPDALEEEEAKSEQEMLSLEVPVVTTTTSSRSRSLMSNDSLSSPLSSQELGFFTESSDKSGHTHDNEQDHSEGQDHGEVFSPLPSPAVPLSLDQSKHTPMEFFRIDSKDSASEVTCLDFGEQRPPNKQVPLLSTSDLGSDIPEDLPELAQEVKGHSSELWSLDCSDKGSNESVPVISFKEAVVADEGHPPDLLVNLPAMSGTVDSSQEELETSGVCLGLEATASPQKCIQPDVLQLHSQPEEEEQTLEQELSSLCTASAACDTSVASSSPLNSLWDDYSLAFGIEASDKTVSDECQNNDLPLDSETPGADSSSEKPEASTRINTDPSAASIPDVYGTEACAVVEGLLHLDGELSGVVSNKSVSEFDKKVSRLFAKLDELSLAASQARIPEEFVRRWAVEMVTALDSLHQEGIICRDLNPNNILLDHQGHVQITYFCSWSDVEESCDKEAIANMYCAPEVGGISEETAACDWWSLGAILFELLTGMSLLRCHPAGISRHTALSIPESVSEEARSLLEQLLQYNPMERLGAGAGGVDDIKSHPFFARVHWSK